MDWFERLTGFRETGYDDTRAKLRVSGSRLQSLINGKSYGIGELELVSLHVLRDRLKSNGGPSRRLKVSVMTGDVRQMHQSPENAGALFQVASQFNLLEMTSYDVTPSRVSLDINTTVLKAPRARSPPARPQSIVTTSPRWVAEMVRRKTGSSTGLPISARPSGKP